MNERARKEAVDKWSTSPAENPRYGGATPADVGRALLRKPVRHTDEKVGEEDTRIKSRV